MDGKAAQHGAYFRNKFPDRCVRILFVHGILHALVDDFHSFHHNAIGRHGFHLPSPGGNVLTVNNRLFSLNYTSGSLIGGHLKSNKLKYDKSDAIRKGRFLFPQNLK